MIALFEGQAWGQIEAQETLRPRKVVWSGAGRGGRGMRPEVAVTADREAKGRSAMEKPVTSSDLTSLSMALSVRAARGRGAGPEDHTGWPSSARPGRAP